MKLKNKNLIFIITATVFLVVSIFTLNAVMPGTKHSQGNILITIDGYTMTLQEGIDNNYLKQGADSPTSSLTTSVSTGHDATQIWVSVNGVESTLQDAINGVGLGGSTSVPYTGSINPGHLASEIHIEISGIPMTLQQAIDTKKFHDPCGDGVCDTAEGETCSTCPQDCGACCTPRTCTSTEPYYYCGTHSDGCSGTVNCGSCSGENICFSGWATGCNPWGTCTYQCGITFDIDGGSCCGDSLCGTSCSAECQNAGGILDGAHCPSSPHCTCFRPQ